MAVNIVAEIRVGCRGRGGQELQLGLSLQDGSGHVLTALNMRLMVEHLRVHRISGLS